MFNKNIESISPDTPELVTAFAALTADAPESNNLRKADPENKDYTHTLELTTQKESANYPELTPTLSTFTATAKLCSISQPLETLQQTTNPLQAHAPFLPPLNTTQETPNHEQNPTEAKTSPGLATATTLPSEKAGPLTLTIINETYYEISLRAEYSQHLSPNKPPRYPYLFDTIPPRRNKKIEIPRHNPNPWLKKLTSITLFQGKELSGQNLDPIAIMTAKTLELTIYSKING